MILGVTGGSGCGKSSFSKLLAAKGAQVIDADETARQIVEPGMPALGEIAEAFGREYLCSDGTLDRKKLGKLVFSDAKKLHILNKITHKYIIAEIKRKLDELHAAVIVIDAALLFETPLAELCTRTVCVLAEERVRAERIMARDGLSEEQALDRIRSQQKDAFYISHADDVIYNNGTEKELKEACQKYWEQWEK